MAPHPPPIETPDRKVPRPRRSTSAPTRRRNRTDNDVSSTAAGSASPTARQRRPTANTADTPADRLLAAKVTPDLPPPINRSPGRSSRPGEGARRSTLAFRGLLLVAAAVTLAFTVTALIGPPGRPAGVDPTSPEAPAPAVLVQPDR